MITAETLVDQLDDEIQMTDRAIDRFAFAHDASHYLLIPQAVATRLFRLNRTPAKS